MFLQPSSPVSNKVYFTKIQFTNFCLCKYQEFKIGIRWRNGMSFTICYIYPWQLKYTLWQTKKTAHFRIFVLAIVLLSMISILEGRSLADEEWYEPTWSGNEISWILFSRFYTRWSTLRKHNPNEIRKSETSYTLYIHL